MREGEGRAKSMVEESNEIKEQNADFEREYRMREESERRAIKKRKEKRAARKLKEQKGGQKERTIDRE
ncbi:unnamed protein product [Dovyalis caffra]|uniref:Uncharacterized protein n=1 Tax=Dovyalis caffra TaxID=77055 RepID=A0AAV1RJN2_9ROSI|nr:unnamed protein product [Dovyalis caffra]